MKKKKKILLIILLAVLLILGTITGIIIYYSKSNLKAMDETIDKTIQTISESFDITEVDCGEYQSIKVYGIMKFHVKQYKINDIGNLCIMTINMGFMQMATIILTPSKKDIPLISIDYMFKFSKRSCYIEFYNTVLNKDSIEYKSLIETLNKTKENYSTIPDFTPSESWHNSKIDVGIFKESNKKDDEVMLEMIIDEITNVIKYSISLPILNGEDVLTKAQLQKEYSNGLIENRGVSTNFFIKEIGESKTKEFYEKVVFYTGEDD